MKSETELIDEALNGDTASYGQLVERFHSRLFAAMLHVVNHHEEAEDVVQETFVQAYVKLHTFRGNSQFYTWLYRIAFNNALSKRRRYRAEISIDRNRELTGSDPHDDGESPEEPLLRDERVAMVRYALERLTPEHREILVLREMEELSYEEIAQILSLNIGTVRSRLSRAREQLKLQLEQLLSEGA
ncbi:MAG: RNA polymerase sigma factor [Pirellulaceae bacterium]|nr:MAG: RNA polymerase sigma factor [Pirellulaceae bacterium]